MFELLKPLLSVVDLVLNIVQLLIFASIVLSWINVDNSNPVVSMIRSTTEPMYTYMRRWTSRIPGPLDWAPLSIILIIIVLQKYIRMALQA